MTAGPAPDPWVDIILRHRVISGRYVDLEPLGNGHGGVFSITIAANDTTTGDRVVLKFLKPDYQNTYRGECFTREVQIARALIGRKNIVQLRSGPDQLEIQIVVNGITAPLALSFYVLERATGTFAAYLLRRKPPSLHRRLDVVRDMVKGTNRLHVAGYCHRDLKPDNLLLFPGGTGKVSDFGTCRLLDADEPPLRGEYDAPPGALAYTAPEIVMGGWNQRSLFRGADWFAVGSVLFEALAGINLYVHIGLQNDIGTWLTTFKRIPESERLRTFERHVEDIAGRYPIPSIREFWSGNPCLDQASEATILSLDRAIQGLCHFDHRRRFIRFEEVLRILDISLGHARLDERRRSALILRGFSPALSTRVG